MTEDAQRQALAQVVNAISQLDITQAWGEGKTSSSDGQRFRLKRRVLQQTYSHRFHDYALEFYSFVADNYAPFYSTVIECTERDAPYVLDGLLYLACIIYWQAKDWNVLQWRTLDHNLGVAVLDSHAADVAPMLDERRLRRARCILCPRLVENQTCGVCIRGLFNKRVIRGNGCQPN